MLVHSNQNAHVLARQSAHYNYVSQYLYICILMSSQDRKGKLPPSRATKKVTANTIMQTILRSIVSKEKKLNFFLLKLYNYYCCKYVTVNCNSILQAGKASQDPQLLVRTRMYVVCCHVHVHLIIIIMVFMLAKNIEKFMNQIYANRISFCIIMNLMYVQYLWNNYCTII